MDHSEALHRGYRNTNFSRTADQEIDARMAYKAAQAGESEDALIFGLYLSRFRDIKSNTVEYFTAQDERRAGKYNDLMVELRKKYRENEAKFKESLVAA